MTDIHRDEDARPQLVLQLLIDRTGSMADDWPDTISAINAFVPAMLRERHVGAAIRLAFFDSFPGEPVLQEKPVIAQAAAWKALSSMDETIQPRGDTPLYDAIGLTLDRLGAECGRDKSVHLAIMTDGLENASTEYSLAAIRRRIAAAQKRGWMITFLGAGIEAARQGMALGVRRGMSADFVRSKKREALLALGERSIRFARHGLDAAEHSEEERKKMRD